MPSTRALDIAPDFTDAGQPYWDDPDEDDFFESQPNAVIAIHTIESGTAIKILHEAGTAASGDRGHAGRPGQRGGSMPSGVLISPHGRTVQIAGKQIPIPSIPGNDPSTPWFTEPFGAMQSIDQLSERANRLASLFHLPPIDVIQTRLDDSMVADYTGTNNEDVGEMIRFNSDFTNEDGIPTESKTVNVLEHEFAHYILARDDHRNGMANSEHANEWRDIFEVVHAVDVLSEDKSIKPVDLVNFAHNSIADILQTYYRESDRAIAAGAVSCTAQDVIDGMHLVYGGFKESGTSSSGDYNHPGRPGQRGGSAPSEAEKAFNDLATQQRGAPEAAMLKVQRLNPGVLATVVENTGDLIHRMSEHGAWGGGQYLVQEKLHKVLPLLTNPYGFQKEVDENIDNNARYRGMDADTLRQQVRDALQTYGDEHAKLPTYNRPQYLANRAAIAVGSSDWSGAISWLESLQRVADLPNDEWLKAVRDYQPDGYEG